MLGLNKLFNLRANMVIERMERIDYLHALSRELASYYPFPLDDVTALIYKLDKQVDPNRLVHIAQSIIKTAVCTSSELFDTYLVLRPALTKRHAS